jgi:hypothetical protein
MFAAITTMKTILACIQYHSTGMSKVMSLKFHEKSKHSMLSDRDIPKDLGWSMLMDYHVQDCQDCRPARKIFSITRFFLSVAESEIRFSRWRAIWSFLIRTWPMTAAKRLARPLKANVREKRPNLPWASERSGSSPCGFREGQRLVSNFSSFWPSFFMARRFHQCLRFLRTSDRGLGTPMFPFAHGMGPCDKEKHLPIAYRLWSRTVWLKNSECIGKVDIIANDSSGIITTPISSPQQVCTFDDVKSKISKLNQQVFQICQEYWKIRFIQNSAMTREVIRYLWCNTPESFCCRHVIWIQWDENQRVQRCSKPRDARG